MFDNLDDPRQQMLLAMGLGLLGNQSGNVMQDIGRTGLLGLNTYNAGKQRQAKLAEEKQQQELRAMQMEQMKRAQADQAYAAQIAPQFFSPGNSPSDGMGPAMPPKMDLAGYGQALMSRNPSMGIPFVQAGAKAGPQYKEVGGRLVRIGPDDQVSEAYAPPAKPAFQQGQTREIKSGRRIITQEYGDGGWKTISTSLMDKPESDKGPAAPQGYRWTAAGGLEPIPGGPADSKAGKEAEKDQRRAEGALARADVVLDRVKEAIGATGATTAGWVGAIGRNIPGTKAFDLTKTIDTIKANIGFQELQAMREASPTGGALGQVAVQELNMLQSVIGSLDTAQSSDQLLKSLYAIEKHFTNWKRLMSQAGESKQPSKPGGWSIQRVN